MKLEPGVESSSLSYAAPSPGLSSCHLVVSVKPRPAQPREETYALLRHCNLAPRTVRGGKLKGVERLNSLLEKLPIPSFVPNGDKPIIGLSNLSSPLLSVAYCLPSTARDFLILDFIFKGGLVDPRLRASNEHIPIVRVPRAGGRPGYPTPIHPPPLPAPTESRSACTFPIGLCARCQESSHRSCGCPLPAPAPTQYSLSRTVPSPSPAR